MSESTEKKSEKGCMYYIIWFGAIMIVLNFVVWLLSMTFHRLYPSAPATEALIPFQNNYLAFTDAFVTSELGSFEFTSNSGPISRLFFSALLIIFASVILFIVFALIPGLHRLGKYITGWFFVTMIIAALLHATFIPSTLTIINQSTKQVEVTDFVWGVFPNTKTIPFQSIQDFDYKLFEHYGHDHSYTIYAQLLVLVNDQKILIAENEVGYHSGHQEDHDAWKMSPEKRTEIDRALQALRQLAGIKTD